MPSVGFSHDTARKQSSPKLPDQPLGQDMDAKLLYASGSGPGSPADQHEENEHKKAKPIPPGIVHRGETGGRKGRDRVKDGHPQPLASGGVQAAGYAKEQHGSADQDQDGTLADLAVASRRPEFGAEEGVDREEIQHPQQHERNDDGLDRRVAPVGDRLGLRGKAPGR